MTRPLRGYTGAVLAQRARVAGRPTASARARESMSSGISGSSTRLSGGFCSRPRAFGPGNGREGPVRSVYRARYPEEAAAVAAAPTVRPVAPFGWIAFAVQQPNASSLADSGGHRAAVTGLEIRMDARLRERLNWASGTFAYFLSCRAPAIALSGGSSGLVNTRATLRDH